MTYKIIIHNKTLQQVKEYHNAISNGIKSPGYYLGKILSNKSSKEMPIDEFIESLLQTKQPQIFAESDIIGNGNDWNQDELKILGDINIACEVTVYDDGEHHRPKIHNNPFKAHLLFTPGALLRNDFSQIPVDYDIVDQQTKTINFDRYYQLYEQRLLPLLQYANLIANDENKKALVTIPGIGCGQFAGIFRGQMGNYLAKVLEKLLQLYGKDLTNIQEIYFDPYNECKPNQKEINGITLSTKPLIHSGIPQLSNPEEFNPNLKDFMLFSIVAWDHISWPGNDYWIGSRATDDGVKAAATDVMKQMTGIDGKYSKDSFRYIPPYPYQNWLDVVQDKKLNLKCNNSNLLIFN